MRFGQMLEGAKALGRKVLLAGAMAVTAVTGLAGFAVATSQPAAAAIDVTAVTAAITDAGTAVATVGGAVLVVIVGIFVWKWIARAI